jgi:hypothetical protein
MALHFTKGILDRGAGAARDLLDKSFDTIWARRDEFSGVLGKYFDSVQADSDTFKMTSVGSSFPLPKVNDDTEGLPFDAPAGGFPLTVTLLPYRQAARITDNIIKADRYGRVKSMVAGLVKSPMRKKEYQRADIFNSQSFSGTAGADSLSLCNDSHPHENNEAGTWDNLGTGALTHGNLQALRLLGAKMTNEQGFPYAVTYTDLLIPPDLLQKATELVSATQMPENALNQPNVLIRSFNIVVSEFLTSATAYFLLGKAPMEEMGLFEAELIPLNTQDCRPSDNPDIVWAKRTKFMNAVFYTASKYIAGSAGT